MTDNDLVELPRDLVERIVKYLVNYEDEGPYWNSWRSDTIENDTKLVKEALGVRCRRCDGTGMVPATPGLTPPEALT